MLLEGAGYASCCQWNKALIAWAPLAKDCEEGENFEPFGQWLQIACKQVQEKIDKGHFFLGLINTHSRRPRYCSKSTRLTRLIQ